MTAELHTRRLLLRPLQLSDAEQTQCLFPHWDIVKFLNSKVPWPYPADRVLRVYRDEILPGIERGEEWHWTLRLKEEPDQHIGVISLHRDEWDNRGYWLGLPWHRQGLMGRLPAEIWEITAEEWRAKRTKFSLERSA